MGLKEMLADIDAEIEKLERARALLTIGAKRGPGRPKGVTTVVKPAKQKPHRISPEGRKRIAEGQRRRWAAKKKVAGK